MSRGHIKPTLIPPHRDNHCYYFGIFAIEVFTGMFVIILYIKLYFSFFINTNSWTFSYFLFFY